MDLSNKEITKLKTIVLLRPPKKIKDKNNEYCLVTQKDDELLFLNSKNELDYIQLEYNNGKLYIIRTLTGYAIIDKEARILKKYGISYGISSKEYIQWILKKLKYIEDNSKVMVDNDDDYYDDDEANYNLNCFELLDTIVNTEPFYPDAKQELETIKRYIKNKS